MKRFAKGCLILVVSLVITGVVLLCVAAGGGVNRATFRTLSNQHALRFGPFYLYMDGPLSWHVMGRSSSDAGYDDWDFDYDDLEDLNDDLEDLNETVQRSSNGSYTTTHYEFNTDSINSVVMDLNGAEVKVLPSDNEKVQIDIRSYAHTEHTVEMSGDTLDIYYDRVDNIFMNFGHRGTEVKIYLPEDFQTDRYDFDVDASDVDVDVELCARNISMDVDASDMKCSKTVQADQMLELNLDAGDLSIGKVLCNGDMKADCNAGNLEVDGKSFGNITADVDNGDAEFELKGNKGVNCTYILKGNMSDMEVNGQDYDELDTDVTIQGDAGAPVISLSCDVGSLEFRLK